MTYIDGQLKLFKALIENSILENGVSGKASVIRSSQPINLIHDAVKHALIAEGVAPKQIFPRLGNTKPEVKISGFLKQKNQDVCAVPHNINRAPRRITWGPLAAENVDDENGELFSANTLVVNIRSQMSSIAKNTDTLFERTFAEALNLHMAYPKMVTGEVYLIPVFEYDDSVMGNKNVRFKNRMTNIAKYISFFSTINGRASIDEDLYKYERCALLVVDFRYDQPKLYESTDDMINDKLLPRDTLLRIEPLAFSSFATDILSTYNDRFSLKQLKIHN